MILTYRSIAGRGLYKQLEKHLGDKGYQEPWKRYEIITDIDEKLRQDKMPVFPYLILGLHGGIEPIENIVFTLHRRIIGSRIFLIKYLDVKLNDRMKSHEMIKVPFLWEGMANIVFSIHAMPNEWLERKVAIGGLPKETQLKLSLIENFRSSVGLDAIIANGENGFKEKLVQGSSNTNPVNYTCKKEGVQIEFPEGLLKSGLHDEKIVDAIIDALSSTWL